MRPRQGRHPIAQDGSITPLEEDAQPAPQVRGCLGLLLPRVPCKGRSKLLHLRLGNRVPTTKGFCNQRKEGNALPPALLLCPIHLPAIGVVQGVTSGIRRTWHCGSLQGGDNGDIQGSVLATNPVGEQDVGWPAVSSWQ